MEIKKDFELVYHPNRRNLMAIPAAIAAILWGAFGLWALFFHKSGQSLSFWAKAGQGILWLAVLGFGVWCVWLAVHTAKQTIRLTDKGIALLNEGKNAVCFYKWSSLPHVYPAGRYLILSDDKLKKGQRLWLKFKAAWLLKIRFDDTFVLWNNKTETGDAVFDHIQSRAKKET